ncbi:glucose-6-phosphate isomerase [Aneurinibacillus terranovensis]|uniref:glucose-6-phosphate isomerase n=1 Tax=Aneurinibacillus terranovensis TaxID=278991 RepID=UPI000423F7E0|nr:glucose-6-phosphate isomerase [Aneurinibacillus terranovensis]
MTKKEITLDYSKATGFFAPHELEYIAPKVQLAHDMLHNGTGAGSEYTGWLDWPLAYDKEEFARIKAVSRKIREKAEAFVVIGIGGSYLGARSAVELLQPTFYNQLPREKRKGPAVYFVGNNISSAYIAEVLDLVKDKDLYINVISKSGTTLEPALAFRIFRNLIEERYGKEGARERIITTTDKAKGVLKGLADDEGYETFVVPDEVGGRFSVLTAVGLLPIAVSGVDIDEIMTGAAHGYERYKEQDLTKNPAYQYAAIRNILYSKGKTIELLVNYEASLIYFSEWWKQLFGESEGKDNKGLYPASVNFTTDLHSVGQFIQDGSRVMFNTTLWVEKPTADINVPALKEDIDGLNYLVGKTIHNVNEKAAEGTILAHTEGGVPNLRVNIPEITPYYYGQLVYFFEKACGISAYLLGVNPFDQPGVEAYKKNMFALLGKPGK